MESDKRLIARGIALAVAQYCCLGYAEADICLVAAGQSPRSIDWENKDEYPSELLDCCGSISMEAFTRLIPRPDSKLMFITDGAWSASDKMSFNDFADAMPGDAIRIVKVGSEQSYNLKPFEARRMVFDAESILEALDGWLCSSSAKQEEVDEW